MSNRVIKWFQALIVWPVIVGPMNLGWAVADESPPADDELQQEFYATIQHDNVDAARKILDRCPSLAKTSFPGVLANPPLKEAVSHDSLEMVRLLIGRHADVNAKAILGGTALGLAACRGHKDIVELLVANGADLRIKEDLGFSPLGDAIRFGRPDIEIFLRLHGADLDIFEASALGRTERVKQLLDADPALVNSRDPSHLTPLHYAARGDYMLTAELQDVVHILIAYGADIGAKDKDGLTPLHWAARSEKRDVAGDLLAQGAESDIFSAAALGRTDDIRNLLMNRPDLVNARLEFGRTPLHWAVFGNQKEAAELLLSMGAEVNAPDQNLYTSLHHATSPDRLEVMESLLKHGADVNAREIEGWTPLHCAFDVTVRKKLIEFHANPDARNNEGKTPDQCHQFVIFIPSADEKQTPQ